MTKDWMIDGPKQMTFRTRGMAGYAQPREGVVRPLRQLRCYVEAIYQETFASISIVMKLVEDLQASWIGEVCGVRVSRQCLSAVSQIPV